MKKQILFPVLLIIRFTWQNSIFSIIIKTPAILKETSDGTSYLVVRWVFRPFCQFWRSICTSESLRASSRISPTFTLINKRSPPFGSQQINFNAHSFFNRNILNWSLLINKSFTFISQSFFFNLSIFKLLVYLLNSLARVTRRVINFKLKWKIILDLRLAKTKQISQ